MVLEFIFDYFEENVYLLLGTISFFAQLGVPVGAMFFIMYSGSVSSTNSQVLLLVLCVFALMVLGDIIAYKIGDKYGAKLLRRYSKYGFISKSHKASSNLMNKYGSSSVFLTRFLITGLGPAINYLAGLEKFEFKSFLKFIIVGEIIYAFIFVYLGFIFKETFEELFGFISDFFTLILLGVIIFFIMRKILIIINQN